MGRTVPSLASSPPSRREREEMQGKGTRIAVDSCDFSIAANRNWVSFQETGGPEAFHAGTFYDSPTQQISCWFCFGYTTILKLVDRKILVAEALETNRSDWMMMTDVQLTFVWHERRAQAKQELNHSPSATWRQGTTTKLRLNIDDRRAASVSDSCVDGGGWGTTCRAK